MTIRDDLGAVVITRMSDVEPRQRPRCRKATPRELARLGWWNLIEREPRLIALAREAASIRDDPTAPRFCAHRHWYGPGGLKERVSALVGWSVDRSDPVLRSSAAYDLAYEVVYSLLPNCRHGGCCG